MCTSDVFRKLVQCFGVLLTNLFSVSSSTVYSVPSKVYFLPADLKKGNAVLF